MPHFLARVGLAFLIVAGGAPLAATAAAAADGAKPRLAEPGTLQPGLRRDGALGREANRLQRTRDNRPRRFKQGCSPFEAVGQARGEGLRRAEVADVSRGSVVVEGRGRYGWGRMVFANMPGCPLIAH